MEGQIVKALSGFYYVKSAGKVYQTRGRGNLRQKKITPLVGDKVIFQSENEKEGVLEEILPRKNQLVRPPIANIDYGIIVMSAVEPDFSSQLLDRFLMQLEFYHVSAVIYVTKLDLVADKTPFLNWQKNYEKIGYPVILSSEKNSLETLKKYFKEATVVFIGQSGAGKSTLLNQLDETLTLATGEISTSLGRGRHTTRHVELHPLFEGLVADTPGFSSLDFSRDLELTDLGDLFPEFVRLKAHCRFRQCVHVNEPGCAVKDAVDTEEILNSRYENYLQFYKELKDRKPMYGKKD